MLGSCIFLRHKKHFSGHHNGTSLHAYFAGAHKLGHVLFCLYTSHSPKFSLEIFNVYLYIIFDVHNLEGEGSYDLYG